jgi:hypothetical protein
MHTDVISFPRDLLKTGRAALTALLCRFFRMPSGMDGFFVREAGLSCPYDGDGLSGARGILLGIALGGAFWTIIGVALWAIL